MKIDSLDDWKRTHDCGSLREKNVEQEVLLMGWVNSRRDLGNLIFIDLRDRGGITQIVFDPQIEEKSHSRAHVLRNEWVLAIRGKQDPFGSRRQIDKIPPLIDGPLQLLHFEGGHAPHEEDADAMVEVMTRFIKPLL